MTAAEYTRKALNVPPEWRCREIAEPACQAKLNQALSKNLITCAAYQWGWNNGYWPAIDVDDNVINAVCKCGCFESNTLILAQSEGSEAEWTPANQIKPSDHLASLDEMSTLRDPRLELKPIKAFTRGEETPLLHVFSLDNGRLLKVTQNHGMLLSDGHVVPAKRIGIGARFVGVDGRIVNVTDITYEQTKRLVYNFEVVTATKAGHIVAAEGVLVGDLAWQNQLAHEVSAIEVRRD
jgi:hypothetical protein